ncbi:MFS transporter [Myceligenerans crystallogenes]|uniref:MFS transporter n=1 Tax=Myceligenerans crystallogenes TaxID=316335 RepID=A0ABN2NIZ1_9MICO
MSENTVDDEAKAGLGNAQAGLLVLAFSVFAAVATEMLPVGLLPEIADSLEISEARTGLLVSLYAGMVAVLAVPLTIATRRIPRKRLLLIGMGVYAASNLVSALAPGFAALAVGRAIGGATHALFISVAIGYAARLVPPRLTGQALALASAGVSLGFVLGVPLTTALGNAAGWRVAFGALVVLMVVALVLIAVVLPDVGERAAAAAAGSGHRRRMTTVIASNTLAWIGHFTLYTYISVLLLRAGAPSGAVGPLLLVFGTFGLLGVWLGAPWLDRAPRHSALVILALVALGIGAAGAASAHLGWVVAAGVVWSLAWGPVASLYQSAAVRSHATTPELAGAWINATCNIGIAVGAVLGGQVLEVAGIREVAWLALAIVLPAIAVIALGRRAFPARA